MVPDEREDDEGGEKVEDGGYEAGEEDDLWYCGQCGGLLMSDLPLPTHFKDIDEAHDEAAACGGGSVWRA